MLFTDLSKHEQEELARLFDLQFVFVTGKGGVGKSSVSAAIALSAAANKKRVLLVYPGSSDPTEHLWGSSLSNTPKAVAPGVDAVAITAEFAMKQYIGETLGSTKLASVLFHHRVARGLLMGIPGPSDWAVLGRAWSFTKSGLRDRGRTESPYDLVVLDAPASGDGQGMLRVPQVLTELAPTGQLRRDAELCLGLLRDDKRASVVFVTLAEELSLGETEENIAVVRDQLQMPVGPLFINRVIPEEFSDADRALILTLKEPEIRNDGAFLDPEARARVISDAGYIQAARERLQESYLKRVLSWNISTIVLPLLNGEVVGRGPTKKVQLGLAEGR